ncbi:MAG TPA: S-methyl-5-thioribose-1-phosphate isomerase, partial [Spirochaetes bacterium]|nr:S-methyl-5-thioribose-1-phosphate isomerase [Spirochaetota bacterium]
MYYTIKWNGDSVSMLDQRFLPTQEIYRTYGSYADVAGAITDMVIRGAPAIGIAAAMGIALAAGKSQAKNMEEFRKELERVMDIFSKTRPTAVNLFWTIKR